MLTIRPFQESDQSEVISLWERCGLTRPWNDPALDIARKMTVQPELFLVGEFEEQIVASAMAGYDGHRGAVYYLAVEPQHQQRGWGREMMSRVAELLTELGCPKINLMVRTENQQVIDFYQRIGYDIQDVLVLGSRLIED